MNKVKEKEKKEKSLFRRAVGPNIFLRSPFFSVFFYVSASYTMKKERKKKAPPISQPPNWLNLTTSKPPQNSISNL